MKNVIHPQYGTRLVAIVYRENDKCWELWIASSSKIGDPNTWKGTFVEVYPDGTSFTNVRNNDGTHERWQIK